MASGGAKHVVGLDNQELDTARQRAAEFGYQSERIQFVHQLEPGTVRLSNLVVSCSSFERFADPQGCLQQMIDVARPGGQVVINFTEVHL